MPNIKAECTKRLGKLLATPSGELAIVAGIGAVAYTAATVLIGAGIVFVSDTLYPFSYTLINHPLHSTLPRIIISPPVAATLLFGTCATMTIYRFEKNIFYRRIHILIKSAFASVAATAFIYVSNLLRYLLEAEGLGAASMLFYTAEVKELHWIIGYYYLLSMPLFALCDMIRRKIFVLP